MMKILLSVVLALVAFGAGVAGMYYAMPLIAPERVEATQHRLDSLARLAAGDSTLLFGDAALVAGDSMATAADSLVVAAAAFAEQQSELDALTDSLATLQRQLAERENESASLRSHVQDMKEAMQQLEARKEQTVELANTLAKLEDRELEAILAKLNTSVLERLYFEASGRNRQRLLQSMPAGRAASFVGRLVSSGEPTAATSDALSASETPDANTPATTGTN